MCSFIQENVNLLQNPAPYSFDTSRSLGIGWTLPHRQRPQDHFWDCWIHLYTHQRGSILLSYTLSNACLTPLLVSPARLPRYPCTNAAGAGEPCP